MTTRLSRADLLRLLLAVPGRTPLQLADALGFLHAGENPSEERDGIDSIPRAGGPTAPSPPLLLDRDVEYLPKTRPGYWTLVRQEPIERQPLADPDQPRPAPGIGEYPPARPFAMPWLRQEGQWQNLWDSAIQGRSRGRRLDLRRSIARLVKAEPVTKLPRQDRLSFNRPVAALFQWSYAHYPIWPDMRQAWISLRRLLGKKALQSYCLSDDPWGEWRRFDGTATGGQICIRPPRSCWWGPSGR